MYYGDKGDVDGFDRCVGGMDDIVQIYEAQHSKWDCSKLCQCMHSKSAGFHTSGLV